MPRKAVLLLSLTVGISTADERKVDPTFLHRYLPSVKEQPSEMTTPTCHYKPLFGAGDPDFKIVRGIARYGEITVDPDGDCKAAQYPAEEQAWVMLDGEASLTHGSEKAVVRKNDFFYLAPGISHAFSNRSGKPVRAIVMGFKIPQDVKVTTPSKLLIANIDEVKKQVVGGHPPSTLYQLLMGDIHSKRDRLAAARVLTSLFVMEFAPGGTNFPHHHETEEEIYLVLDGAGEMVAGGGADGIEGRRPAKSGDAYFFRLNCTVGFYNSEAPGTQKARILAVRSLFPFKN